MVSGGEPSFVDEGVASDWRHSAECVPRAHDVDFFPALGESTLEAKAICAVCTVREPCLEFALRTKVSSGVWGGLSARERRRLQHKRSRHNQVAP